MKNRLRFRLESAQGKVPEFKWGSKSGKLYRKRDCGGFTLVELIVVIVILAILAAILVPALVGWIDKAKTKRYEMEARNIYLAAETSWVEGYAWGFEGSTNTDIIGYRDDGEYTLNADGNNRNWLAYIKKLSGIDSITWIKIYVKDGEIAGFNVDYTSASDNKKIKAYIKEPDYNHYDTENNGSKNEFNTWFGDGKADDGLWHFYDREEGKPIS